MTKHCVFTDLPPFVQPDGRHALSRLDTEELPAEVKAKRCWGNNCSDHARGAPHRCPVGRCQRYEDAVIAFAEGREEPT